MKIEFDVDNNSFIQIWNEMPLIPNFPNSSVPVRKLTFKGHPLSEKDNIALAKIIQGTVDCVNEIFGTWTEQAWEQTELGRKLRDDANATEKEDGSYEIDPDAVIEEYQNWIVCKTVEAWLIREHFSNCNLKEND